MSYPAISLATATAALQLPVYPNSSPDHRACNSLTPLPLSSRRLSVSTGGFGVNDVREETVLHFQGESHLMAAGLDLSVIEAAGYVAEPGGRRFRDCSLTPRSRRQ